MRGVIGTLKHIPDAELLLVREICSHELLGKRHAGVDL
jgi:hypothetical protein